MEHSILDPSHGGYISVADQQRGQTFAHITISRSPSPSVNDDVFSVTSDNSSQSSIGDSDEEAFAHLPKATSQLSRPCAGTEAQETSTSGEGVAAVNSLHPRRSCSSTKTPPSLARQDERKVLFVNDLVDSATSLVSVIWPLSGMPCPQAPNSRGVLPLRRYIEETLRRSRTSYSTLQVALYYLILIKPHVNRVDLVADQSPDAVARRAMQCGRRMFLSALILASKYLQDRNYSAKAWSKMSGLKTTEINSNERHFLEAVSWKLHIPEGTFKRWTDIVLRFTATPTPLSPSGMPVFDSKSLWARVIPLLSPELDDPRIMTLPLTGPFQSFAATPTGFITPISTPTPPPTFAASPVAMTPREDMPSPATLCPRFLEPKPDILPPTPGLIRMGPLPTPQMTPSISTSTPAASACSSRRPSMSMAMCQAQNNMFSRMTLDRLANAALTQRSAIRFPSVAPSTASCSSPESMISDRSRSSRSSSISSTSTMLTSAPRCASLARSATSQFGGIELINLESTPTKCGTAEYPIILDSPEMYPVKGNVVQLNSITPRDTRKRARDHSHIESVADEQLQAEVRALLLQNDAVQVLPDTHSAITRVSPCALRKAMANLNNACPFSGVRSAQPPAALRRSDSTRLPLVQDNGRKRVCSSVERSEPAVPDIFMEVADSVWQGVA